MSESVSSNDGDLSFEYSQDSDYDGPAYPSATHAFKERNIVYSSRMEAYLQED